MVQDIWLIIVYLGHADLKHRVTRTIHLFPFRKQVTTSKRGLWYKRTLNSSLIIQNEFWTLDHPISNPCSTEWANKVQCDLLQMNQEGECQWTMWIPLEPSQNGINQARNRRSCLHNEAGLKLKWSSSVKLCLWFYNKPVFNIAANFNVAYIMVTSHRYLFIVSCLIQSILLYHDLKCLTLWKSILRTRV